MSAFDLLAQRTVSYSAAELDDTDAVKKSFATATDAVELGASDYDGDGVTDDGEGWAKGLARSVTISRASSVGSYSTDPIVLTGRRGTAVVTEQLTPSTADGDDVLRGAELFDFPPTIAIPAQEDASGFFEIGAADVGAPAGDQFLGVKLNGDDDGDLVLGYIGGHVDTLPAKALTREPVRPTRVIGNQDLTPASGPVTVYVR